MIKFATLIVLPSLAACATIADAAPEGPGSSWTFVSIDGRAPVSDKTSLTISPGRIGANVGCNGLGGDLKLEPGRMIVGPVISTQMYCDGVMEQERAVAELLGASPSFFIEGDRMGIRSDKHVAELHKVILR